MYRWGMGIAAIVLAGAGPAQAATVIDSGTFDADDFVYESPSTTLGPGRYRFVVQTSVPVDGFFGDAIKQTTTNFYCDEGDGEFACGGDDVPTYASFTQVNPSRYLATLTVDAPQTVYFGGGGFETGYDEFDSCCEFEFSFETTQGGSYTLSYGAVPEPALWMLMILGFGAVGGAMRKRRTTASVSYA
ncbi:PEPxxWA-CTERM sorting domain-containing protein [Erythrobacter sp. LQ02-29]|uniref:PEPxxWA-CTERM sorting domain-containing protein n=1 Tax=Erythrobacter sp. LQ02-29 TaxID=2920384 RepID=UPI001F4D838A|nr:PEPxxWA-CTERM sorting domain-containing protein [Erythrobacter sp. LQ02-29]MCP9222036.1 PEPxxWA-CTERM sorting domain-containing protein [Erythrobacter sp. LQ02-29]